MIDKTLMIALYGALLSTILLILEFNKYKKNKPIIKVLGRPTWNINPVECHREITIPISNSGNQDTILRNIFVEVGVKTHSYLTEIVYPNQKKIGANEIEDLEFGINLPRSFDLNNFEKNNLPFRLKIGFDFSHKKIRKSFWIGKKGKLSKWFSLQKHLWRDHRLKPLLHKIKWHNKK